MHTLESWAILSTPKYHLLMLALTIMAIGEITAILLIVMGRKPTEEERFEKTLRAFNAECHRDSAD
jgi:hypothetical protein